MAKFGEALRGLTVFISDIRNCKSKEAERKRINKELANIRSKFKGDRLDGYQKKKYVCKLVFIFLLGNDVDFGYQEAVNLLSSTRFSEKQIGYLFVSVLIGDGHDLMPLIIQGIRHDVESHNPTFNTLAMQCIANIANKEMVEQLGKEIPPVLTSPNTQNAVKQTAALCLLKMLRVNPRSIPIDQHAAKIVQLLNDKNLGVVTAACSLLEELAHINSLGFMDCVPLAVTRLSKIVSTSHSDLQDYTYYFVPAPWLTVKLLRLLQCFDIPDDPVVRARLSEALEAILNRAQEPTKSKKVQYSNSKNSVLFEGINLILHFQGDPSLQVRACNLLGGYLTHKETNMRYMSLETLSHLAISDLSREAVKKHQDVVLKSLKNEKDISVRQRAIDLLYAMCDRSNAKTIVEELLQYLENADYSIRETLVLKMAILSEKFAVDFTWYVDTILNLIRLAGDYVSEEVWYRIIQIVINREDVQGYAAKTCFESLQAPACHENMIKVGGYILGEFGNLIAGDNRSSPLVQFQLLHSKFHLCSVPTRALLLSTYVKFVNLFPEIKTQIQNVLKADNQIRNSNQELQQRAIEYLKLSSIASADLMATVLEEMPAFPDRESSLLNKLYETAPWTAKLHQQDEEGTGGTQAGREESNTAGGGTTTTNAAIPNGTISEPNIGISVDPLINTTTPPSSVPPAQTTAPPPSDGGLLVNVMDVGLLGGEEVTESPLSLTPGSEEGLAKFLLKNNGVLFENDVLQIGVKAEYKKNLGRLCVFYGNKSSTSLQAFTTSTVMTPEQEANIMVSLKDVPSTIDAGAQIQQIIDVECKNVFTEAPRIKITFNLSGTPFQLLLQLPVYFTKFMEPSDMGGDDFFSRWKQLGTSSMEAQNVFSAKYPQDNEAVKAKLLGIGVSVLAGVDPNSDNFVSAGILYTKSVLIGCLLRLEPNKAKQLYRLTIRTSSEVVSKKLFAMLSEQF